MANTNRRYLSFDFVKDNIKDPIINFSRGSTKTIIDKNTGLVRTLGVNVPAAFDDACGRQELWKAGSKNLFPYSNDFSTWSKGSGTSIVQGELPIVTIPAGSYAHIYLPTSIPVGTYTLSFSYRGSVATGINIVAANDTDGIRGTLAPTFTTTKQRASFSFTTLRTNSNYVSIASAGGGSGTFEIGEIQIEAGAAATAYEPNPVVIQPGFLIEGATTNYLPYSRPSGDWGGTTGVSFTTNYNAAPDGTNTATRIQYNGTGTAGNYRVYGNSDIATAGQKRVLSWWIKSNSGTPTIRLNDNNGAYGVVTLTTTWRRYYLAGTGNAGSGWQPLIYSPSGDNSSFDISVWGVQVEDGRFPSSAIPTSGAAVTRAADAATVDISKIWNASEGTVICEADFGPVNGALYQYMIDMTGNSFQMYRPPAGTVLTVPGAGGIAIAGSRVRAALSMFGTSVRSSVIGSSISSGTKSATASNLFIGTNSGNGEALNGTIQRLEYWPKAEDDYMLQLASNLS